MGRFHNCGQNISGDISRGTIETKKNKGMGKKMNSIGNYACKSWINSMEVICHINKISR